MKNKGFTLIELLAVIVILAIIALIATPIILGIINDARNSAKERTAELIANEVELAYTGYMYKNNGNEPTDFCTYMAPTYFTMDKGTLGSCANDQVTVTSGGIEYIVKPGTTAGTVEVSYTGGTTKTVTLTK